MINRELIKLIICCSQSLFSFCALAEDKQGRLLFAKKTLTSLSTAVECLLLDDLKLASINQAHELFLISFDYVILPHGHAHSGDHKTSNL